MRGRRLAVGILGSLLLAGVAVAPPATGDPTTVAEAEAELAQYQEEASQAEQAYHDIHDQLTASQAEADSITAEIAAQQDLIAGLKTQVAQIVLTQYQNQGLSSAATLLASESPERMIQQAATTQRVADQNAETVQRYQLELGELADQQARLDELTASIAADDARLAELEAEAKAKAAQAQEVLDRLEAEAARQAAAAARAATAGVTTANGTVSSWASTTVPAYTGDGSLASIVVQFGLSKVGGPYVWGGNGPTGYDCSGLTRAAYLEVGISLPHNAAAQMEYGTPVSTDALLPGDLLFYYSPVGHVAIYIGDGQIVHASTYGVGIVVSNAFSMSLTGARRYV